MHTDQTTGNNKPLSLIIIGPTASGKTALADFVAQLIGSEVINADMGQLYTPLSIGTAKPDWKKCPYQSHLFDIIDDPKDLSSHKFRSLVLESVNQITQRKNLPIIVGGSLFYVKSLFFPQQELPVMVQRSYHNPADFQEQDPQKLWDSLYAIDPERAAKLHVNDVYRVKRALAIWEQTGQKPSLYEPVYTPACNALIVAICPPREVLRQRIMDRTVHMIMNDGWINEAKKLINTPWEPFLEIKGLIGYTEIFEWIRAGELEADIPKLIEKIQFKTLHYAKRQMTFLNGLIGHLDHHKDSPDAFIAINKIVHPGLNEATEIVNFLRNRELVLEKKTI